MSNTTISDYHSKAINDYGLSAIWPEKALIESKIIEDKFICFFSILFIVFFS